MCSVTQSRLTLCTLWTVADQAPLSWGFSWQEYGNGLPFPLPGDFPGPGTLISCIFFFAGEVFTTEPLPLGKGHDRDYLGLKRVFFLKEMDSFAHQPVLPHHIPSLEIKKIGPVETGHWDAFLWATYPSSTEGILPSASKFLMEFQKCLRPEKKNCLSNTKRKLCAWYAMK